MEASYLLQAQFIFGSGIAAATLHAENYLTSLLDEINVDISAAQKVLERLGTALIRCPVDFAVMKRIRLHASFASDSTLTILDLNRSQWQEQFSESSQIKGI